MGKGNCFHDLHITVIGDFGIYKRPEQIRKWISGAEGKYSSSLKSSTTHVVVTEEHWKRKVKLGISSLAEIEVRVC